MYKIQQWPYLQDGFPIKNVGNDGDGEGLPINIVGNDGEDGLPFDGNFGEGRSRGNEISLET